MISVHSAHMSTHHDLDQWNLNQDKRLPKGLWKIWSGFYLKWHSWILKCFTINVEVKETVHCSDGSNYVWSSMFDCLKPKIGCSSLITKRWTRLSSFGVQKMMFELVWCSLKWCPTHHQKRGHFAIGGYFIIVILYILCMQSCIWQMQ